MPNSQTTQMSLENAQNLLMRIELGLNPAHDLLVCVRTLHNQGKEAFEKLRGPRCDYAHEWRPLP